MAYRTLRPLRVGGLHYAVGEALPDRCLLVSRAKALIEMGYIADIPDEAVETPRQEPEQPPKVQPKAKGRKKAETAGDA